jgi:hypothetical protein
MEKYIRRENLALSKKCLADSLRDTKREVRLKLLADEEAQEPRPKNKYLEAALLLI